MTHLARFAVPVLTLALGATLAASGGCGGKGSGDPAPEKTSGARASASAVTEECTGLGGASKTGDAGASKTGDAGALIAAAKDAGTPVDLRHEAEDKEPVTLEEQRTRLYAMIKSGLGATDAQMATIEGIFAKSKELSQGNPEVTQHPMSRAECRARRKEAKLDEGESLEKHLERESHCGGARNMVPVYNPGAGETEKDAKVCIDEYEFPDLPCEYPVVHVAAREAEQICQTLGRRLCDTHEWEGACAGALHPPEEEYIFNYTRESSSWMHNQKREVVWAYGKSKDHSNCATGATRVATCQGGGWKQCPSTTYPTGAYPKCVSSFGVYDQHGNAAEHMSIPRSPAELGKNGGSGMTEMKGSWFIFGQIDAHPDDCRWRAPSWHDDKVTSLGSHWNYHLGFRCCKDVGDEPNKSDPKDAGH